MTMSHPGAAARRRLAILEPWLYSAPALILIIVTTLVPIVIGISYAFRNVMLLDPTSGGFVGLDNFRDLMRDASFWNALKNTVTWTASCVGFQFLFGLILALLLNRPFPGRSIIQPVVFLPWAIPTFV
ncbi:MAG: sugar ABC transporter permease, partial [Mesorhizobium sp.]|nr:sugar ABC transporter permease [Mesorhizobium sp.]